MRPRNIVIFEQDERFTDSGKPELDWRGERQALPTGSSPIVTVGKGGEVIEWEAQHFTIEQVAAYKATLGIVTA